MYGAKYWGESYWGAKYWGDSTTVFISFGIRAGEVERGLVALNPTRSAVADMVQNEIAGKPQIGLAAAEPEQGAVAPAL